MADQQQQQNGEAILRCKQCGKVGTIDDHFTYKTKTGIKPLPKCRKCHNLGKYQKKPTGWAKLPPETQDAIRARLKEGIKMTRIADEHGVSYANLKRWVGKGDHLSPDDD